MLNIRTVLVSFILVVGLGVMPTAVRAQTGPPPTHYVDALNGDDSNPGTSPEAAWRTLLPVRDALSTRTSDMRVQVAPGAYTALPPAAPNWSPPANVHLTVQGAQDVVAVDTRSVSGQQFPTVSSVNVGNRAVVEPVASDGSSALLGPAGQSSPDLPDSRFGSWTQTVVAADDGTQTALWTTQSVAGKIGHAAWAANRDDPPNRIHLWISHPAAVLQPTKTQYPSTTTVGNWAKALGASSSPFGATWGMYQDGSTLYLITHPAAFTDPNAVWITTAPSQAGIVVDGPNVEINNLAFDGFDMAIRENYPATNLQVDHNDFESFEYGLAIFGKSPNLYTQNTAVSFNRFADDGLVVFDHTDPTGGPRDGLYNDWWTNKSGFISNVEPVAVWAQGGPQNGRIASNEFLGMSDAIAGYSSDKQYDDGSWAGTVIEGNSIHDVWDDAINPSRYAPIVVKHNLIEYTGTAWSSEKLFQGSHGSAYFYGNLVFNVGSAQRAPNRQGRMQSAMFIKLGSQDSPTALFPLGQIVVANNTMITNDTRTYGVSDAGGPGANMAQAHFINNIVSLNGGEIYQSGPRDNPVFAEEHHNILTTSKPASTNNWRPFALWCGAFWDATSLRNGCGLGGDDNPTTVADIYTAPLSEFVNPDADDYRLNPGSPLQSIGAVVAQVTAPGGPIPVGFEGAQ